MPQRRTPLPRATTPIARTPIRRKQRSASEKAEKFFREYGGPERHAGVETLPCIVLGCPRKSVNAHVVNIDAGTSRKGHHRGIAPLCDCHHTELHDIGPRSFERIHHLSLDLAARRARDAWDALQRGAA
jgi:hypothetical protein